MAKPPPEIKMADFRALSEDVRSEGGPGRYTKEFNEAIIQMFRATGGKMSGELTVTNMVLLTTVGVKSGKTRTVPLGLLEIEDRLFIIASRAGSRDNPAWYDNITAHPIVTVEHLDRTFQAQTISLAGEERDRIFEIAKQKIPVFAEYEKLASRIIPVVELRPIS